MVSNNLEGLVPYLFIHFGIYHEIISHKKPNRHVWGASGVSYVSISCNICQLVHQYVLPVEDDLSCPDNLFSKVLRLLRKSVLH